MTACPLCFAAYPDLAAADGDCLGELGRHHSAEAQELARVMARAVHGEDATEEQAGWFADDATAVIGYLGNRAPWVVTASASGAFMVNGVLFDIDPNAEGYAPPEPVPPPGCPDDCEPTPPQHFLQMTDAGRVVVECGACGWEYERDAWWAA